MNNEENQKSVADMMNATSIDSTVLADAKANRLWGVICYLWWLCLIPLIVKKDSPFVQHHARSGVILSLLQSLWWLIYYIVVGLSLLIFREEWTVTFVISAILSFVTLMFYLVSVLGILRVLSASTKEIPFVNDGKKIISKIRKKVNKNDN